MKKITLLIIASVSVIIICFFLQPNSESYIGLMRLLNQDTVYLKNGEIIHGWVWDQKQGLVIGETTKDEIFILNNNEYRGIERKRLLGYLRQVL